MFAAIAFDDILISGIGYCIAVIVTMAGFWLMLGRNFVTREEVQGMITDNAITRPDIQEMIISANSVIITELKYLKEHEDKLADKLEKTITALNGVQLELAKFNNRS